MPNPVTNPTKHAELLGRQLEDAGTGDQNVRGQPSLARLLGEYARVALLQGGVRVDGLSLEDFRLVV